MEMRIAFGPQAAWTTTRQCMSSMSGSAMCRYVLRTVCNYIYKIGPWGNKRGRETMPRLRLADCAGLLSALFKNRVVDYKYVHCMYMIHSQWLPMQVILYTVQVVISVAWLAFMLILEINVHGTTVCFDTYMH